MPMVDPFVGSIAMTAFNWAPVDWAKCDGQSLQISQHAVVYALLGSKFGGNDRTFFNIPDLRGRVPLGTGFSTAANSPYYQLGNLGGQENVVISPNTMPAHTHALYCTDEDGTSSGIRDRGYGAANMSGVPTNAYTQHSSNIVDLTADSLPTSIGGNLSHNNIQPSTVINFVIALDGLFPPRN